MRNHLRRAPLLLAACAALLVQDRAPPQPSPVAPSSADRNAAAPAVVLIVRHAEKAAPTADPPLSAAGERRAAELARVLGQQKLAAIYTTTLQRTALTAEPLAQALGLPVTRLAPEDVDGLAQRIEEQHRGHTVLVVGHSNTIPDLIARLGAAHVEVADDDYGNLFVVFRQDRGRGTLVRLRYGD